MVKELAGLICSSVFPVEVGPSLSIAIGKRPDGGVPSIAQGNEP